MALLDIIFVNYNSTDYLINSIDALFGQKIERTSKIIVVDNCSADNVQRAKQLFPEITLLSNRSNIGFGAAVNQGLVFCHSKFVAIMNPDCLVTPGFIDSSIRFMEQNQKVAIMGPMILDEDCKIQGSARAFPTPLTSLFGRKSRITRMFPNNSLTRSNILNFRGDLTEPLEVDWVSGACMIARRDVLVDLGGFDRRFFLYWEDTDLCRRARDAGWKVIYFSGARVMHSVGKSSCTRPLFSNFQFHKSCYRLYAKYAKWPVSIFTPLIAIALMLRFAAVSVTIGLKLMIARSRNKHSDINCGIPISAP